jgi:hypothetical protein
MNKIIKMFLHNTFVRMVLLHSTGATCMFLSRMFRELDSDSLWKEKISREGIPLFLSLSYKEYYFTASSVMEKVRSSPYEVEIYLPVYDLEDALLDNLALVLPKQAAYGIYSLKEKKEILSLAMQELASCDTQRHKEIKEICFNFNFHGDQGDFGITIKDSNLYSHLFNSSSLDRTAVLFLLCYFGWKVKQDKRL